MIALHIEKRKSFRILLLVEIFLLLWGVIGLFGKDAVYEYGAESMTGEYGNFENIALSRGVYKVSLYYDTDTDMKNRCEVEDASIGYKQLFTNGAHLYAGLDHTDFTMWLWEDTEHLSVNTVYGGEGNLSVTGLIIAQTNAASRMLLFWVVILSMLVNLCYLYRQYDGAYEIPAKKKNVAFGLGVVILFTSLPLMVDYVMSGGDIIYHLMRIEGIKDGLMQGQFPVRIAPEWLRGHGYASSVFYGETLLYMAAFFRLIGFSVWRSYQMFYFLINVVSVLTAYYCFKKIFQEEYIGLLCSFLYNLSLYRCFKAYPTGAFGECFGIMFLPFLAYGFYRVFTEDVTEKSYGRSWIPLTIGFTGIIQSHLLTGEMAGFFTILLCFILWKKVFRKQTFLVLAKTVIYSSMLSAWFLVPFMDYMVTGDFVIQHVSARKIQEMGLYPAHFLLGFFHAGPSPLFTQNGMAGGQPMGVGSSLMAALLIFAGVLFFRRAGEMKQEKADLGRIAGGFAVLSMLMSLSLFPWDAIQSLGGMAATLVSSIQFPNRLLTIATVCLTVVAGVVAEWFLTEKGREKFAAYFAGMVILVVAGSIYMLNAFSSTTAPLWLYNGEGMGVSYVSGGEYLPYGTDSNALTYHDPQTEENVTIEQYDKKGLTVDVQCRNTSDREGAMGLPLLYYKGYIAQDKDTGERIPIFKGNNNELGVAVPAGYEGVIQVAFQSPWYWRAAEMLSVLTFIVLCGSILRRKQPSVNAGRSSTVKLQTEKNKAEKNKAGEED